MLALALAGQVQAKQARPTPLDPYLQARVFEIAGESTGAADAYSRALTASPADPEIALRAYRRAIEAGDRKLAVRAATVLRGQPTMPGDAHLLLLVDDIDRGDWAAAGRGIDQIQARTSFDFLAPALRAWTAFGARTGDPLAILDSGGGLSSTFNRESRILLLLAKGDWRVALDGLRLIPAIDDRVPHLRLSAAARLTSLGQKQAAIQMLNGEDSASLATRYSIEAGRKPAGQIATARAGIAYLFARLSGELTQQSPSQAGFALARIAAFAEPGSDFARLSLARALSLDGQDDAALTVLAAVSAPLLEETRAARIDTLVRNGRNEEALVEAGKGEDDAASLLALARLQSDAGRHADAARAYKGAIDGGGVGAGWQSWMMYGAALDATGDWPGAKAALEQSLRLAPEEPAILNQLGYAMLERGDDLLVATAHIAKANRLQPDNPAIVDSLGWAFHLRGRAIDAVPLLERAAAMRPGEAAIGEHLGDVYWTLGRRVDARYAWNGALTATDDRSDIARITLKLRDGLPLR